MQVTDRAQRPKRIKPKPAQPIDNLNAQLYNDGVLRQVNLVTYEDGLVRRAQRAIRKDDDRFIERIAGLLSRLSDRDIDRLRSSASLASGTDRTKALQAALIEFGVSSRSFARGLIPELGGLAYDEALFWMDRINIRGAKFGVKLNGISQAAVAAQWRNTLILGERVVDLLDRWASFRAESLASTIRRQYSDGIETRAIISGLEGPRGSIARSVEGVPSSLGVKLRTIGNGASSAGQLALQKRHAEFIDDLVWTSILDTRTSSICWSRHSKLVNGDLNGALPPAHPRCRSQTVPHSSPHGPIPIKETATEWMDRQPEDIQLQVMGPARFAKFRTGSYRWPQDFINDRGKLWTLDDLKKRTPRKRKPKRAGRAA